MTDRVIRVVFDPTGVETGVRRAETSLNRIDGTTAGMRRNFDLLKGAVVGVVSSLAVREIVEYADAWTQVNNRIRLVSDTNQDFATTQRELLDLANRTRTSLAGTVELYSRVARSTESLNLSQQELIDFVEATNQAIQISGATSQEASAGVIQFSQGLAAGALRGDELRAVLEQMPRLARALADGLGVSIGELRALGQDGALTAEAVIAALQTQFDALDREFQDVERSAEDAFVVLNNGITAAVGSFNDGIQATSQFSEAIQEFGEGLSGNIDLFRELGIIAGVVLEQVANGFAVPLEAAELLGRLLRAAKDDTFDLGDAFSETFTSVLNRIQDFTLDPTSLAEEADRRIAADRANRSNTTSQGRFGGGVNRAAITQRKELADATKALVEAERNRFNLQQQFAEIARRAQEEEDRKAEQIAEVVNSLEREIDALTRTDRELEKLNRTSEIFNFATEDQIKLIDELIDKKHDEIEMLAQEEEARRRVQEAATRAANIIGDGFLDAATGADSFGEALEGVAERMARLIIELTVVRPLVAELEAIFGGEASGGTGQGLFGGLANGGGGFGGVGSFLGGLFGLGSSGGIGGAQFSGLFASGGSFTVGGSGGVDSQLVSFMATPGERVSVQTPGQAGDGLDIAINIVNRSSTEVSQGPSRVEGNTRIFDVIVSDSIGRLGANGTLDPVFNSFGAARSPVVRD